MPRTHRHTKSSRAPIDTRVEGFTSSCGIFILILATGAIVAKVLRPFFPH